MGSDRSVEAGRTCPGQLFGSGPDIALPVLKWVVAFDERTVRAVNRSTWATRPRPSRPHPRGSGRARAAALLIIGGDPQDFPRGRMGQGRRIFAASVGVGVAERAASVSARPGERIASAPLGQPDPPCGSIEQPPGSARHAASELEAENSPAPVAPPMRVNNTQTVPSRVTTMLNGLSSGAPPRHHRMVPPAVAETAAAESPMRSVSTRNRVPSPGFLHTDDADAAERAARAR